MIYETPDQYELRTMPEAFHKSQGQGCGMMLPAAVEQHSEEFYRKWREYEEEEKRKAILLAKIDNLWYQCRKNSELDAELTPKIIDLEDQLNNFHLLPKHIL